MLNIRKLNEINTKLQLNTKHICIISNSPTLRPCLPSSKKRSKHRKAHKIFISSKIIVVILLSHLKNERGYKR